MKWQVSINCPFYKYIKIFKTSLDSGCPEFFPTAFYLRYFALQKNSKHGWHSHDYDPFSLWRHSVALGITLPIFLSFLPFWDYSVTIYHHWQLVKKILTDTCLVPSILKLSQSWLWYTGGIIHQVWRKTRLEEFPTICVCPGEIIITELIAEINLFMGNRSSIMWDIKAAFTSFSNFDLEVLS